MDIEITGISRIDTPLGPGLQGRRLEYRIAASGTSRAFEGPLIGAWTFGELLELCGLQGADAAAFQNPGKLLVQCGGWQSWSAGWELGERERLPRKVALIPELLKQTNREGDALLPWEAPFPQGAPPWAAFLAGSSRPQDWLTGHFIVYIRSGDRYLCLASREGGFLPPVSCRINRSLGWITAELFCPGKVWYAGETVAELCLFFAQGYFNFKDALRPLYHQDEVFGALNFLRETGKSADSGALHGKDTLPGGYESWYNHYTDISEGLILRDLEALGITENLIRLRYLDRDKPAVFQIDDGWEKAVGEWEADPRRFPQGLGPTAARIEKAGFIPGLWLAPFVVTRRSRIFSERPGWLLREKSGEPAAAGYNPHWDKQFYCLDLSRKDVLEYLGRLMEQVIDEWGFRYLKLDFLYAGLLAGDFAEGGSPYEHYERACSILTGRNFTAPAGGGPCLPVAYLGCGLPLGPSYRHFPLSRIGADTRETWDWELPKLLGHVGRPGAYISLMDTIGRSYLDGAVYINDPDVIFLRSKNCKLEEHEKELIALVNFLLGGQIMFSDDPLELEPGDIALTRRIAGLYDQLGGDEYGAVRIAREVFRVESRSGKTAGLINLSPRPWTLTPGDAPEFFTRMTGDGFLTDHRVRKGPALGFAPHTISIQKGG